MGKRHCNWQDKKYVLSYFGNGISKGKENCYSYFKKGMDQGRRHELVGGRMIKSLGGWSEVKKLRLKSQDCIKGDERILGDGDFVGDLLFQAN